MLFEYAIEPEAIGSDWQTFRYIFEKFGFDRGRLISQFPKAWVREVYAASADLMPLERKRIEVSLASGKQSKFMRSGRPFDPALGGWLPNAVAQQGTAPFHAIIASANANGHASVLVASELDECEPLMEAPQTWQVPRTGSALARAIGPLLTSARTLLFVDRYFDVQASRYKETLKACLDIMHSRGVKNVRCEIHYGHHHTRPSFNELKQDAATWLRDVIPADMSVFLYAWNEKPGGEDFHARNLLTDAGGISVEAGFSAEGLHQHVQIGLLPLNFTQCLIDVFAPTSTVYDLAHPVLEILSDGTVRQI
jgi:hypothetical protein